jgi:hypothetical protein
VSLRIGETVSEDREHRIVPSDTNSREVLNALAGSGAVQQGRPFVGPIIGNEGANGTVCGRRAFGILGQVS